jgi:hypothetical protein
MLAATAAHHSCTTAVLQAAAALHMYVCACVRCMESCKQGHSLMVTSPSGLCSILSMPLGPRDERSVLATVFAAKMLAFTASVPRTRDLLPCSCTQ